MSIESKMGERRERVSDRERMSERVSVWIRACESVRAACSSSSSGQRVVPLFLFFLDHVWEMRN